MRLGAYYQRVQFGVPARVYTHFDHHFVKAAGIARYGMKSRSAEIGNELYLPFGVACGSRNGKHSQPLRAVLESQAAGEHSVARGVLENVARAQANHVKATRNGVGPFVEVALRVQDYGRRAGCAARGMQAHHLAQRHRRQAERVIVAQILLCGKGNLRQVVEAAYVVGLQMVLGKAFLVKRRLHTASDCLFQTLELQVFYFGSCKSF